MPAPASNTVVVLEGFACQNLSTDAKRIRAQKPIYNIYIYIQYIYITIYIIIYIYIYTYTYMYCILLSIYIYINTHNSWHSQGCAAFLFCCSTKRGQDVMHERGPHDHHKLTRRWHPCQGTKENQPHQSALPTWLAPLHSDMNRRRDCLEQADFVLQGTIQVRHLERNSGLFRNLQKWGSRVTSTK